MVLSVGNVDCRHCMDCQNSQHYFQQRVVDTVAVSPEFGCDDIIGNVCAVGTVGNVVIDGADRSVSTVDTVRIVLTVCIICTVCNICSVGAISTVCSASTVIIVGIVTSVCNLYIVCSVRHCRHYR